jgi:cellulose synthase/poly-beta-1,6-N-acetylglucosamine synthase-like glycosyltransferase
MPSVSIVVAARNEETHVASAARALLAQQAAVLEIVFVDDRSTDATGAILDGFAVEHPRLQVRHVATLPDGWLGKTHALQVGAAAARGTYILFTDADVILAPTALARGVSLAEAKRLDHLAVLPAMVTPSLPLQAFVAAFGYFFTLYVQPWRVSQPASGAFIGIGAFNLVRAEAYRRVGGYESVRLCPDDDLMLGKRLKQSGARQEAAIGLGMMEVEWYPTFRALVDGLMKNMFAGLNFSIAATLVSVVAQVLVHVGPFVAMLVTTGWTRVLALVASTAIVLGVGVTARSAGLPSWSALFIPLSTLGFCYVLLRSMMVTLVTGGISWRGTHYPLEALKRHRF